MRELTMRLNQQSIPFSFKVLYDPEEYGRYDSGVLYIAKDDYLPVQRILDEVYQATESYFQPEVPLFTKKLFPGMGLAEEQMVSLPGANSFGLNRSLLVARGLLTARDRQDESPPARLTAIVEEFTAQGVSLSTPYLNPNSEDIYR